MLRRALSAKPRGAKADMNSIGKRARAHTKKNEEAESITLPRRDTYISERSGTTGCKRHMCSRVVDGYTK